MFRECNLTAPDGRTDADTRDDEYLSKRDCWKRDSIQRESEILWHGRIWIDTSQVIFRLAKAGNVPYDLS